MRHFQMSRPRALRALAASAAVAAVLATTGCHWFSKKDSVYQQSAESRPLEVPPDLDRPNTEGAMAAAGTQSVTRSSMAASRPMQAGPSGANGFLLSGDRDDAFTKVGAALTGMDGVTISGKAQLLGTYDVSYQGASFLVRVNKADAGAYVAAVDARGMPTGSTAATQLIAALKAKLGGN